MIDDVNVCTPPAIYCEWDNRCYVREQLIEMFSKYLAVMIFNGWDIEVHTLDDINEGNVGHVAYHAEMFHA